MSKSYTQQPNNSESYTPMLPPPQYPPGAGDYYYAPSSQTGVPGWMPQHPSAVYEGHDRNRLSRTPSPTPSEIEESNSTGFMNLSSLKEPTPKNIAIWVFAALIIIATILAMVLHDQIVTALEPAATWMKNLPEGWLIPIGILFVMSFPPLFGHELVGIMVGLVWGLGEGFAIAAGGQILGEIACFLFIKLLCKARTDKMTSKSIGAASLVRVVQEGGFMIAVIIRYSIIPPHFTTAVFSACGMNLLVFIGAAVLSLPKVFVSVYIGYSFGQSANDSSSDDKKSKLINLIVIGVTVVITVFAMKLIRNKLADVKPQIIYERRKARQMKRSFSPQVGV